MMKVMIGRNYDEATTDAIVRKYINNQRKENLAEMVNELIATEQVVGDMGLKKEAAFLAELLHSKFVAEYDEPLDGDGIAEAVKGFRDALRTLSGDK
jgi:hypothetical protein